MTISSSPVKKTKLATASLIFGICGLAYPTSILFFSSIAGIICGHMAKSRIKNKPNEFGGPKRAKAGLIISYFALALGLVISFLIVSNRIQVRKLYQTLLRIQSDAKNVTNSDVPANNQAMKLAGVLVAQTKSAVKTRQPGDLLTIDLGNSVYLQMVWIPPGSFVMGSPVEEFNRGDDEIQHRVTLTKGFWMGKYEVTQLQYEQVMGTNPSRLKGARNPVENLSLWDCMLLAIALNENGEIAKQARGGGFSLPTEAEWEYACRAGTTGPYAGNLEMMGWFGGNSWDTTHPVGQKEPNAWGLYDMHGNVWEWCFDWYKEYPAGNVTDPRSILEGKGYVVVRGGCFANDAGGCRSACRGWFDSEDCYLNKGFRLAMYPK